MPTPGPSSSGPAPTATFDGTIAAPPPTWDPYAPATEAPGSLLTQDPTFQFPAVVPGGPTGTWTKMQRLIQEVRVDYVFMPGKAKEEFGINDVDLSVTAAIPFLYNPDTPLLVTPGFAVHYWSGPKGLFINVPPVQQIHLPPRVYDAYLDAAWNPQVTSWLGGELAFRVGIYSDFHKVTSDALRYTGTGLAVLSFTPSIQVKAGVTYLDRNRVKILPAGGIIWTPNDDIRFEILFPNPKIARRLTTYGNTEWWGYARGEYGGGAWLISIPSPAGDDLRSLDYNDMRFSLGLEFTCLNGFTGLFESGIAFERELYHNSRYRVNLNSTVFVRGGLAY